MNTTQLKDLDKIPLIAPPRGFGLYIDAIEGIKQIDDPLAFTIQMQEKYGDVFRIFTGKLNLLMVCDPEVAKDVLMTHNADYKKSFGYEVLEILLGEGLLTSLGDKWKKQRRLIQPAFSRRKLTGMVGSLQSCVEELIEKWEKDAANEAVIDVHHDMMWLTLEMIAKVMFSTDVRDEVEVVSREIGFSNAAAMRRILNPVTLPTWVPTPFNLRAKKSIENLNDVVYKIIKERRDQPGKYDDLLETLIAAVDDEGVGMTDQQLRDEVMTIFVAGHETTAVAMSWMWYLLSQNRDKEAVLLEELRQKLPSVISGETNYHELIYTKQVVEESMRLYPPAWVVGRKTQKEEILGGYRVPPNTNVLIHQYIMHRDQRYWKNADTFEPERFKPETRNEINRFVYMPFGAGPRVCVGIHLAMLEMMLILAELGSRFRLSYAEEGIPDYEAMITLRPKNGMPMKITKR